jgi:hypothetical protein
MINLWEVLGFKKIEGIWGIVKSHVDPDPFKDRVWAYYFEMKSPQTIGISGASFSQKGLEQTVTFKTYDEAYTHLLSKEDALAVAGIKLSEELFTERMRRVAQKILKKEEMMA